MALGFVDLDLDLDVNVDESDSMITKHVST